MTLQKGLDIYDLAIVGEIQSEIWRWQRRKSPMLFQPSPPLIFFTIEVGGAIYPVGYRLIRVITSSCKSAFLFVKETNKPALELGFH